MDVKLSKTSIRKQVGGNLLTSILSMGRTLLPTLGKTLGISALAGEASERASQVVKKISGKGSQVGGFLIPHGRIHELISHKDLLSIKQKKDLHNALQMGSPEGLHVKLTKKQSGGFLRTVLASIGIIGQPSTHKSKGPSAPQIGL